MISVGIALCLSFFHFKHLVSNAPPEPIYDYDIRAAPLFFAGAAAIGAGIMTPFKRMLWGAKMGVVVVLGMNALLILVTIIGIAIFGV